MFLEPASTAAAKFTTGSGRTSLPAPSAPEAGQGRINPLPKWRLRRVQELVDTRLGEPLSLAALAAAAGLSRMHFAAQFRAATGKRPHDYLLQQRIERSISLMDEMSISLAELALTVGFQSQSHFSTVFKRFTGQTPAAWRNASRSRLIARSAPPVPALRRRPDAVRTLMRP
jgi:AraC-like DNA-binding protein